MDAPTFYQRVQERGRLTSLEKAQDVTHRVARSLAQRVGRRQLKALGAQIPAEIAREFEQAPSDGDELINREVFVGRLVNAIETEYGYDDTLGGLDLVSTYADNDVSTQIQAVFETMKETIDEQTAADLAASLPDEIGDWFRDA